MFVTRDYRQELQQKGVQSQTLTIQYRGGGGRITSVEVLGFIPIPNTNGKVRPFRHVFENLVPNVPQKAAGLTATLNGSGDELVITGGKGSPVILCVEPRGTFETPGEKAILLNAQVLPIMAKEPAVGQAVAQGQATKQELTYKIALKATPGENGEFQYKSNWELTQPSPKGGFIIQMVNFSWSVENKAGTAIKLNTYFLASFSSNPKQFDEKWYPYLEAWEVKPGEKTTTIFQDAEKNKLKPPFDDLIQAPGFVINKNLPTKGVLFVGLNAKFYEEMALPKDFKILNAPPAGKLPVKLSLMGKDAKLPDGGSNEVKRSFQATWDSTKDKFLVPTEVKDQSDTKPAK
jgi:hypothetical protein